MSLNPRKWLKKGSSTSETEKSNERNRGESQTRCRGEDTTLELGLEETKDVPHHNKVAKPDATKAGTDQTENYQGVEYNQIKQVSPNSKKRQREEAKITKSPPFEPQRTASKKNLFPPKIRLQSRASYFPTYRDSRYSNPQAPRPSWESALAESIPVVASDSQPESHIRPGNGIQTPSPEVRRRSQTSQSSYNSAEWTDAISLSPSSVASFAIAEKMLQASPVAKNSEPLNTSSQDPHLDEQIEVLDYLESSPPESPASVKSISGVTTDEQHQRAKAEFKQLIQRDQKFHDHMQNSSGIQDWWFENCGVWSNQKIDSHDARNQLREAIKKRDAIKKRQRRTTSYISQQLQTEPNHPAELEKLEETINRLEKKMEVLNSWFLENRELQKLVWQRFQEMQRKADDREPSLRTAFIPEPIHEFDFIFTDDYRNVLMIQQHGLVWWFENAFEAVKDFPSYFAQEIKKWDHQRRKNRKAEKTQRKLAEENVKNWNQSEDICDQKVQMYRQKILDQPQAEGKLNEEINKLLDGRKKERVERKRMEKVYNDEVFSCFVLENFYQHKVRDLRDRQWRATLISGLVKSTGDQLRSRDLREEPQIITDIIQLCHYEHSRREFSNKIDGLITVDVVKNKPFTTQQIIDQLKQHWQNDSLYGAGRRGDELWDEVIRRYTSTALPPEDIYTPLKDLWIQEYYRFVPMVQKLQGLIRNSQLDKLHAAPIKSNWKPSQLPPLPSYPSWGWRPNCSIATATKAINHRSSPDKHLVGYKLFRFFNSPDIFHYFWGLERKWKRVEFHKYVQSMIKYRLRSEDLDNFLIYCNFTGELFNISAVLGYIYVSAKGWEHAPEAHVSGIFLREKTYEAPKNIHRLERALREHSHAFYLDRENRVWSYDELLRAINKFDRGLTMETLEEYVHYWTGVGRFFVATYRSSIDDTVFRIDNGWEIPETVRYVALTKEPYNFADIHAKVLNTDIRPACMRHPDRSADLVWTTEVELYDHVFNVGSEEFSFECTRFSFHMYLRWCDKLGKPFKILRDGDVLVNGRDWGVMDKKTVIGLKVRDQNDVMRGAPPPPQKKRKER